MNLSSWKTASPGKELEDIIYDIANDIVRELSFELDTNMRITLEFKGSADKDWANEFIEMVLKAKGFRVTSIESEIDKMTISFE